MGTSNVDETYYGVTNDQMLKGFKNPFSVTKLEKIMNVKVKQFKIGMIPFY